MFIQVIQGHVSDSDELMAALDRWIEQEAPGSIGWLGSTAGVTEDGEFIGLFRFESVEAARQNSDRPEQHQWWMETAKLFSGDVTFHDCEDVVLFGRGGSDDAGFVQVMQGRVTDAERAKELWRRDDDKWRDFRPEVIGGVSALHGDGGFTTAVYFTSEAEARVGERKERPPELQASWDEEMSVYEGELTYFDLRQPWLKSRS